MSEQNESKGNILVVDNNPENLRLLEKMLTDDGYKVRPAISGSLALMTVQSALPDLVLLDVRMPDIDGFSVCEKLKSDDTTKDIPVIFISALEEPINKLKAFDVGGLDYITKPFEAQEVLARVKTQINLRNMQKRLTSQNKLLHTEISERKEIERQLHITQHDLERRVEERTKELVQANIELQAEIQERKEAEDAKEHLLRQLQQAQKLEAIGTLAGGIAHDFNNILTIIHTCSQLILNELQQNSSAFRNIEKILKASERASELVSQILTFSRKSQTTTFTPITIVPILKETVKLLKSTLSSNISLNCKIDGDSALISGDAIQIYQVIMNLCTNSFHAMENMDQATLTLSLTQQNITKEDVSNYLSLKPGMHVKLTVQDTGEGIDPSIIERIFDPYFTTKGKGRGTGLGLAVTMGIVEKHKGAIYVESKLKEGTTVNILFPIIDDILDSTPETHQPIHKGSEHIFLVDDEVDLLHTVKLLLEHLGYKVTAESNPIEALAVFEKNAHQYDLVMADMVMPKMNGKQLAQKIREIRADLPIMICSGKKSDLSEEENQRFGITGFLMKPFLRKELSENIRKLLNTG
ncbi:MAG: response regulator [Candidatus Magnetomorum sp.]|nr:response regulator [Candidatus Magnetomorum sp.]